jgi:hypothetical protein
MDVLFAPARLRGACALLSLALCASAAHAVASRVTLNDITFSVIDLRPDDGIAAAVVFDPELTLYGPGQVADVLNSMDLDFRAMRCTDCPVEEGSVEFLANTSTDLAARTLAPNSLYIYQTLRIPGFVGVTPCTQVTVSANASFNLGLSAPLGSASLELALTGRTVFPDHVDFSFVTDRISFNDVRDAASVELTYTNTGDVLSPLNYAYVLTVSGRSAPPIPEPASVLLMTMGLGLVAWQGRRHMRR